MNSDWKRFVLEPESTTRSVSDINQLQAEVASLKEQLRAAVQYIQDHEHRLIEQQDRLASILESRAWKAVCHAGEVGRSVLKKRIVRIALGRHK